MITSDPVRDALDHLNRIEAIAAARPVCDACGEPIWEDTAVEYDGKLFCAECEKQAWEKIRDEFIIRI